MRWLFATGALVVVLLVAALAGIGWLVGTEAGLHWAAAKVPELHYDGLHGRLAGEISAKELRYSTESLGIRAESISLRAHLAALLGGRLTIEPLRAALLEIDVRATDESARTRPPALPLRFSVARVAIDAVEITRPDARYSLRNVEIEHARLGPDVSLSGSFVWPDERFATRGKLHLRGTLERIEAELLADVAGMALDARALLAPFTAQRLQSLEARAGRIDLGRFVNAAPHTALNVLLNANLQPGGILAGTISLANSAPGTLDAERLPVITAQARFSTDFAAASFSELGVALLGGGRLYGQAQVGAGRVNAKLVARAVDLRSLHSRLRKTALHGPLELVIDGERQFARASLTQEGIGFTAQAVRSGDVIRVQELRALVEGGEVDGTGELTVDDAMRFVANVDLRRFNPAALGDYPTGSLNGNFFAKGRLKEFDLRWTLSESTLFEHAFESAGAARIAGERVTQAHAEVRLGSNRLTARGALGRAGDELALALEAPRLEEFAPLAGTLRANGTLAGTLDNPRARIFATAEDLVVDGLHLDTVSANLVGTLASHQAGIAATAPGFALDLTVRLHGGWSGERGWSGEILSAANAGDYPLELVAPAALRVAPGRIELGRVEAQLDKGRVLVRELAWTPNRLATSGEFTGLPAQWLIVAGSLDARLESTLLVDGEWEIAKGNAIEGFVRVRQAGGDLTLLGDTPVELGLERASLEARFANGRANGRLEAVSRVARLTAQGEVLPALALDGKVELAELGSLTRPFVEDMRVNGRLAAQLRVTGTLAAPELHGTLSGEALGFEYPPYGVALRDGRLSATLAGESLRLESFQIRGGDGTFSASGTLPLGLSGTGRLDWRAEALSLLERPDMRLVVTGAGQAGYDGKRASLTGELRADRGRFELAREKLPKLGDDVVILGETKIRRPAPRGKMTLPVALDLRLDLGDNLVVQSYGYDGKVAGLLDLATNKAGELRAYGRLTAVHATFLAYGQRLDVDPGVVIFDGPLDNPSLQITAWRRNQAVEAGVQVTGTARAPAVNLVSQPAVPEGEKLSWLVLGRPPSGATQADLGLLQAAAGALLAGGDSMPLDRRLARRFGFDELSLRGSGELAGQVVALGKRLSDRLYISYEQGIGAVASSLIKLDYALGRRWTLRAETGSSSGGGLFYRYSWD